MATFEAEAEIRAALRQFSSAFSAYGEGLTYLHSQSSDDYVGYREAQSGWPPRLHTKQGYLHYLLGDLSSSIDHYLRAFKNASAPAEQIEHLLNLGILHQRTQDYQSALYYYQRARRRLDTDSLSSDRQSTLLSRTYAVQADLLVEKTLNATFDRSALQRAKSLAQKGRAFASPGTERHARVSMGLSESLGYLGMYDQAYQLNEEVRQFARKNEQIRLQTIALLKLGILHMLTERWAQADTTLSRALTKAEALGDLDYQRRTLRALGRLHDMQEQWSEAERVYRQGVQVVEEYRESLTASQWSMTAFAQWRDVHRGLVRALLAQNRDREALAALVRSRARHLQDLRIQARVSNQLPPEQRTRFDSLSRALTEVRNHLSNASSSQEADLRNREVSLMAARQQLLQVNTSPPRPSLSRVSEVLAEQDRTLVSYFLDDPSPLYDRSPRSTSFVLTADTLHTVPLPSLTQDSVGAQVESVSPLFTTRGKPDRANSMHFDLEPLHALHQDVYDPVREHLPADQALTIVPDGPLFHVPFSMLVESMPGGRYTPSEARFVLHERPTSLELAASLVADTSRSAHEWSQFAPQMAAYGVSEFDTLNTVPAALRTAIPEALSGSTLGLPPLPGVEKELQSLRSRFPRARVALNEDATEDDFCRSARTAGVLHVASHAFVNPTSPLQNAILLRDGRGRPYPPGGPEDDDSAGIAPDSTTRTQSDGVLFLHELQGQRSRIPMVVLSGCSTARGTLRGGEGMEGLQYAFRAMGAQSTVSTLWPVADDASVELMDAFYENLQDGDPKDVALQQAQLQFLREHPDQASPFFWAPPVLYGSPTALPLDGRFLPLWAWWTLGVAGLLLLVGLLLWWNRRRLPPPFYHLVPQ